MSDLGDLQRAVDYALESVEQRVERIGRRVLRHWYAGFALAGVLASSDSVSMNQASILARSCADAMLAALDESKEARG